MRALFIGRVLPKKNFWQSLKRVVKPRLFNGQSGFFLAAVHSVFDVKVKEIAYLEKHIDKINDNFDVLFIDYKSMESDVRNEKLPAILRKIKIPKILFYGIAKAHRIPRDEFLELFDLVYKREVFIDLTRYNISEENKLKLRTTILSCPTIKLNSNNFDHIRIEDRNQSEMGRVYTYDASFAGAATNMLRVDVVDRFKKSDINFFGAIQRKYDNEWQKKYNDHRLDHAEYEELIHNTKVNLALEGYGQFTFRHLELWCMGGFMLSSPSIRELRLTVQPEEGIHYIAYDDLDDLEDKVRFYSKNDEEREKIARAGYLFFNEVYDYRKHGSEIYSEVSKLLAS